MCMCTNGWVYSSMNKHPHEMLTLHYAHLVKCVVICHSVSTIRRSTKVTHLVCAGWFLPTLVLPSRKSSCHNLLSYSENATTHSEIMKIHLEGW